MSDDGERSFDPTPHRREQFRKEGRFARSKDAAGVVATFAVLAVVVGSHDAIGQAAKTAFIRCHGDLASVRSLDASGPVRACVQLFTVLVLPTLCAAMVAGIGVGLAQSGARINLDGVGFKPERLNPFPNLGKLFSPKEGTVQTLLSLLRVLFVGYVAYRAVLLELPVLLNLSRLSLAVGVSTIFDAITHILVGALAALGGVAIIDYAQSRFSLEKELKMTRKELQDETKSMDGDPRVKAKMRARARAMARKRSLESVKQATVVIANPTHVSVALRYSANDPAPIVVAKGHDEVALAIRAEARKHSVPILENRPLARALDAEVAIGQPIPAAHFAAVAKILAFIYRTTQARRGTRRA